ncbi:hypothetical protein B481_2851 [Planococcus halocryophilus Or1]|nr:hypothetical protein B481_2851 [Planococcus halocryophilus Or1]
MCLMPVESTWLPPLFFLPYHKKAVKAVDQALTAGEGI